MKTAKLQLAMLLTGLEKLLRFAAWRYPEFKARLREKDFTAEIKLRDDTCGRCFSFRQGKVKSTAGVHSADVAMSFQSAELALRLMKPDRSQLEFLHAVKNFQIEVHGPDELTIWLSETLNMLLTLGAEYGADVGDGVKRYTSNTNGGPVFVYVKDGKILRITPIEFDEEDAAVVDAFKAHGKSIHSAAQDHDQQPHAGMEVDGLLARSAALSHEAGRLRPQAASAIRRIAASPVTSGSAGMRRWTWWPARFSASSASTGPGAIMNGSGSHHTWGALGLLAQRAHPVLQYHRLHGDRAQPRQLGRMVLGRHASLGTIARTTAAARPTAPSKTA